MSSAPPPVIRMTANDAFKAKYPKYLRWSLVVAIAFTLLVFFFTPKYIPKPYHLITTEMEYVELPETIELPPPPKDVPPPPAPVEAAPDEEVTEDVEIAETLLDFNDAVAVPTGDIGQGTGEVFVASQEKPELITFHPAEYPEMARIAQIEGTVVVKVLVGPDGSVLDAQIMQGVSSALDNAALVAARRCKFKPGKQRNIPVKAWLAIPYRFRLH